MFRPFRSPDDYAAISAFLTALYEPDNRDGSWFQSIWEYAYTHPWFDEAAADRIGVWEEDGRIVAVATYESRLGEAFFNAERRHAGLKPEMLSYAEERLAAVDEDGVRRLHAFVPDFDHAFQGVVVQRGYLRHPDGDRPMSQFVIPDPFPPIRLPGGFRLQSLADDNDLRKMHRVLHRGFDHPGEPPEDGLEDRRRMQSGPNYRPDLAIVTVAPNGDFASFCGMWYDPANRFGYVEPVATDPTYRRLGLGRAAVLEGIRRCGALGATVAYVGTDKPFYVSFGFRPVYTLECWRREWAA